MSSSAPSPRAMCRTWVVGWTWAWALGYRLVMILPSSSIALHVTRIVGRGPPEKGLVCSTPRSGCLSALLIVSRPVRARLLLPVLRARSCLAAAATFVDQPCHALLLKPCGPLVHKPPADSHGGGNVGDRHPLGQQDNDPRPA